ncbi:prepilin-type N-terminal cleavage/methylation domain-containing protein [uncultured Desulfobacter sp.]|uniref:type IV pilus modification PilV family protein n=1 Tax=uncultured Desulfobacter sp. TaxID=240139 RepID=UPI002AA8B0B3|nr:prepilin-type N-terminal cleavage/methylation domain-containing protein [uncultured Desulfobacter sp.]
MNNSGISKRGREDKRRPGQAGFTLLEVMIATSILAIGILGIIQMHISAIQGNETAWKFTESSGFAANEIEGLIRLPYDDDDFVNGSKQQGDYNVSWTVTNSDPIPNVKKITMTVGWTDKGTTKTYISEYYKAISF